MAALTLTAVTLLGLSSGASAASPVKTCSATGLGSTGVAAGSTRTISVAQLKVRGVSCKTGRSWAKSLAALEASKTAPPLRTHGYKVTVRRSCGGCALRTPITLRKDASHTVTFVLTHALSCVDKVGSNNTEPTIINTPDGICDANGTLTLTVGAAGATITNATFFRTDPTGGNESASGGHINRGVWTTEAGAQNIPGNYVAHLFLSTKENPGPNDYATAQQPLTLTAGQHTVYFFANSDDVAGGTYGFGMNLWLAAAPAGNPSISGYVAVPGNNLAADGTSGCSPTYDGLCGTAANALASPTVTLAAFVVSSLGGAFAP
jgi:hypothetical protein